MDKRKAFLFASVCFLISILLISTYVSTKRAEMTAEFGDEVNVVVATKPIREFETITSDMIEVKQVFKKFRQPQTAVDLSDVVGRSVYSSFYEGEQITLTKLVEQDGRPVLHRLVEKNTRAVTILIAPHTGVGRLIRPGNRVDVLVTPSYEVKGETIFEVKTVFQNILVLATGRAIQNQVPSAVNREILNFVKTDFGARGRKDVYGRTENLALSKQAGEYSNITLQLTPEQAEQMLYLTNSFGDRNIYFTLRNSADSQVAKLKTTLLDDILGPDSDYGKSRRRPQPVVKKPPKFYDSVGGSLKGIY